MVSPYIASSKDYTKKAYQTTPKHTKLRIKFQKNEKAAILKLRQHNYSINQLQEFFGRSTSLISNIIKTNSFYRLDHRFTEDSRGLRGKDLRKLPSHIRQLASSRKARFMANWIKCWEAFILGEVDRPP